MELSQHLISKDFNHPPKKSHIRYPLVLVSISLLHWPLSATNLPPLYRFSSSEHFIQTQMCDKWLSVSVFFRGLERELRGKPRIQSGSSAHHIHTDTLMYPWGFWCTLRVQVELKSSKDWPRAQKWPRLIEIVFKPEETKLLIQLTLLPFSWGNREAPKQSEISYGK